VDVGLHGGGVQADAVTGDAPLIDGRLGEGVVDLLPRFRCDAVSEPTERGVIDHGVVVDVYESAEELAVVDTHDDLPQRAALDALADHHAQHGLAGTLVAVLAGCVGRLLAVQGLGDVAMDQVDQFRVFHQYDVDPVILAVVAFGDFQGGSGLKLELRLVIKPGSHDRDSFLVCLCCPDNAKDNEKGASV